MFGPIKRKNKDEDAEKLREQEETARVYAEFVRSFEVNDEDSSCRFVKAGVIIPGSTELETEDDSQQSLPPFQSTKKSLWLPPSTESLQNRAAATTSSNFSSTVRTELGKGIGGIGGITQDAPESSFTQKTNKVREIDLFLEEIKQKQEMLDPKLRLQKEIKSIEDMKNCNLYLGNLSTNMTEDLLFQQFSRFGKITSVKIMYPRTDEERSRRRYCGFVSFENHIQAENARKSLDGVEFFGLPIRIGWGKTAPPSPQPIPQIAQQSKIPPPPPPLMMMHQSSPTGGSSHMMPNFMPPSNMDMVPPHMMPFLPHLMQLQYMSSNLMKTPPHMMHLPKMMSHPNMMPLHMVNPSNFMPPNMMPHPNMMPQMCSQMPYCTPSDSVTLPMESTCLPDSMSMFQIQILKIKEPPIYVTVPVDARQKTIIDLVAQYVKEDGIPLEKLLKERESGNRLYRFLTETDTENANYYRWKLYSLAQGNTLRHWRVEPFQMFEGCRVWHPPGLEYQDDTMAAKFGADISHRSRSLNIGHMNPMNEETREELENILMNLTRERNSILNAMTFCLDNSNHASEISEYLLESLTTDNCSLDLKIARLYLVSDILHNASRAQQTAHTYRRCLENHIPEIMNHSRKVLQKLTGRLTIQSMKERVMKILRMWESLSLYPPLYIKGLESCFLKDSKTLENLLNTTIKPLPETDKTFNPKLDGAPVNEAIMLATYPFWIRENVKEWNSLDLTCLEKLCLRRGLPISPEISEDTKEEQTRTYAGMRQLLIQRLVESEAYWHTKHLQPAI